jgi:hypothetical protein
MKFFSKAVHKPSSSSKKPMGNVCAYGYICVNDAICAHCCCCDTDGDVWRESIKRENDVNMFSTTLFPWPYYCYTCTNIDRIPEHDQWYVGCAACVTCPVPCLMLPFLRYWTRKEYGIKGSIPNDVVQSWVCYPCQRVAE